MTVPLKNSYLPHSNFHTYSLLFILYISFSSSFSFHRHLSIYVCQTSSRISSSGREKYATTGSSFPWRLSFDRSSFLKLLNGLWYYFVFNNVSVQSSEILWLNLFRDNGTIKCRLKHENLVNTIYYVFLVGLQCCRKSWHYKALPIKHLAHNSPFYAQQVIKEKNINPNYGRIRMFYF